MREPAPITSKERMAFALLVLLVGSYVVARAWALPFVNDEARTFFHFNHVGRFQPWYAEWDAANHLLCTALGQVCYLIFGPAAWSLRLPSVLAFGLYLWYVWRMGALMTHGLVRWLFWAAMVLMPMLIEFFSLYRGYGMGIAFFLMAVFHLMRYATTREGPHFLKALVGMLLAAYASATLMVLWLSVLALLALLTIGMDKSTWRSGVLGIRWKATAWILLGALPLAYLAAVGMELAKQGALYHGTSNGLVSGSLPSVLGPMFPFDLLIPDQVIAFGIIALLVLALALLRKGGNMTTPTAVLCVLLALEIAGRYGLNYSAGVLFPVDRAAMHFVPLIVMLFAFTIDQVSLKHTKVQWVMMVVLIFPYTTLRYWNLDRVTNWPDDTIPEEVFAVAERYQQEEDRPLAIGTKGLLEHSWALRNLAAGSMLPLLQQVPEGCAGTDLLLLHPADTSHFPDYHRVVGKPTDAVMLLARNTPLPLEIIVDTLIPPNPAVPEHWMLWEPPLGSVNADELLLVLDAVLNSQAHPLEAQLVWETGATSSSPGSYVDLDLALLRSTWKGDTLRLAGWLPLPGQGAEYMSMRVWDLRYQPISTDYCRLRVYRIGKLTQESRIN
jgi:hypothetical protein